MIQLRFCCTHKIKLELLKLQWQREETVLVVGSVRGISFVKGWRKGLCWEGRNMQCVLLVNSSDVFLYGDRRRTCGMSCGYRAQDGS